MGFSLLLLLLEYGLLLLSTVGTDRSETPLADVLFAKQSVLLVADLAVLQDSPYNRLLAHFDIQG